MDILCIDIETGPCYESMARNPFKPDSVKTGNLKDPEKVKAKIADAERDFEKDADWTTLLANFFGASRDDGPHSRR